MTPYETSVAGDPVEPADGWRLEWEDRRLGVARLVGPEGSHLVVVEGAGSDWVVTLRGRRIPVSVRTWRERVLAEAEGATRDDAGPIEVRATLPGLIVAVAVTAGDEVEAGMPLLTIEAMKMQNEVRAPRAGRVIEVVVGAGQTVATGAALLRLE
jgi:acetyl/propionyl-CoA carboxylase alpha subunit